MGLIHQAIQIKEKKKSSIRVDTDFEYEAFITTLNSFCSDNKITRAFLLYTDGSLLYPVFSKGFDLTSSKRFVMNLQDYKKNFDSDFSSLKKNNFKDLQCFFSNKEWESLLRLDSIKLSDTLYFLEGFSSLDFYKTDETEEYKNITFLNQIIKNSSIFLFTLMENTNIQSKQEDMIVEQLMSLSKQDKKMFFFTIDVSNIFCDVLNFSINFNDQLLYNAIINLLFKTIGNACIYKVVNTFIINFILFANQPINANLYFKSLFHTLDSNFGSKIANKITCKKNKTIEEKTIAQSINFLNGV